MKKSIHEKKCPFIKVNYLFNFIFCIWQIKIRSIWKKFLLIIVIFVLSTNTRNVIMIMRISILNTECWKKVLKPPLIFANVQRVMSFSRRPWDSFANLIISFRALLSRLNSCVTVLRLNNKIIKQLREWKNDVTWESATCKQHKRVRERHALRVVSCLFLSSTHCTM